MFSCIHNFVIGHSIKIIREQELQIFKVAFRYINVPLTLQTRLSAMLSFPCEGNYKAHV